MFYHSHRNEAGSLCLQTVSLWLDIHFLQKDSAFSCPRLVILWELTDRHISQSTYLWVRDGPQNS